MVLNMPGVQKVLCKFFDIDLQILNKLQVVNMNLDFYCTGNLHMLQIPVQNYLEHFFIVVSKLIIQIFFQDSISIITITIIIALHPC